MIRAVILSASALALALALFFPFSAVAAIHLVLQTAVVRWPVVARLMAHAPAPLARDGRVLERDHLAGLFGFAQHGVDAARG